MSFDFDKNLTIHIIEDDNDTPEDIEKFKNKIKDVSANELKKGNINSVTINDSKSISIDEGIGKFIDNKTNVEKVKPATLDNYNSAFSYLYLFVDGKSSVKTLTKKFFNDLQNKFMKIPSNYMKKPKANRENINDVITNKNSLNKLDNKTINKHFTTYTALYDFLVRNDYIHLNPVNIKYLKEDDTDKKEEFEYQEMYDLFNYTSKRKTKDTDEECQNIFKFAYLTGMRRGEIFNLKIEDIENIDGHPVINIKDAKNPTSIRLIPTNDDIDKIIDTQIKKSVNGYLFFDYDLKDRHKEDGNPIGKRLNRRIDNYLIEKGKDKSIKSFHSFRKNFSQTLYLERFNIKEMTISKLMGHSVSDNITRKVYNRNKVERDALIRAMKSIKLSDVEKLGNENIYIDKKTLINRKLSKLNQYIG